MPRSPKVLGLAALLLGSLSLSALAQRAAERGASNRGNGVPLGGIHALTPGLNNFPNLDRLSAPGLPAGNYGLDSTQGLKAEAMLGLLSDPNLAARLLGPQGALNPANLNNDNVVARAERDVAASLVTGNDGLLYAIMGSMGYETYETAKAELKKRRSEMFREPELLTKLKTALQSAHNQDGDGQVRVLNQIYQADSRSGRTDADNVFLAANNSDFLRRGSYLYPTGLRPADPSRRKAGYALPAGDRTITLKVDDADRFFRELQQDAINTPDFNAVTQGLSFRALQVDPARPPRRLIKLAPGDTWQLHRGLAVTLQDRTHVLPVVFEEERWDANVSEIATDLERTAGSLLSPGDLTILHRFSAPAQDTGLPPGLSVSPQGPTFDRVTDAVRSRPSNIRATSLRAPSLRHRAIRPHSASSYRKSQGPQGKARRIPAFSNALSFLE